jgi:hypothetical protein
VSIDLKKLRAEKKVITLQGKEYVTHQGLLYLAHGAGLRSVLTDLVSHDPDEGRYIVRAVAEGDRGQYSGYGDASPANVSRNIATACLRMAETRAVNRALRLYTGLGMTSADELPGRSRGAADLVERAGRRGVDRRRETPAETEARQATHHVDWPKVRGRLAASLRSLTSEVKGGEARVFGVTLDEALAYVEGQGEAPLSQRSEGEVRAWLAEVRAAWAMQSATGPFSDLFYLARWRPAPRRVEAS